MEESKNDDKNIEEIMLPGFRFHPTDEELVGFYLRRKIQHKPLSIELIKQLDIYKYDPWDLPKLATTGEKEWYFYCPRDRKYRNSTRPNRVTGAGFWKATGTDRPIYSSEGSKCIGLKKSLVFYKGRAAKGTKTDWMMHEFRLPSISDSGLPKRYFDKNIPANEAWAICRIFKKANSSTQRAISHSWVNSPSFDNHSTTILSDTANPNSINNIQFSSSNIISMANKSNPPLQFGFYDDITEQTFPTNFHPISKPVYDHQIENNNLLITPSNYTTSSSTDQTSLKFGVDDVSSLFLDMSSSIFEDFEKGSENNLDYLSAVLPENIMQENVGNGEDEIRPLMGFPYSFPLSDLWDSSPCPSELSTSYSTNNKSCYI